MGARLLETPTGRHARLTTWDRALLGLRITVVTYRRLLLLAGLTVLGVAFGVAFGIALAEVLA